MSEPIEHQTGSRRRLHVVAAAIRNAAGDFLIAQRPRHLHQGGLWEFPGGKLEPGESRWQGLERELHEELGIRALSGYPLIQVEHDYSDLSLLLDVWVVHGFSGAAHAREGQSIAWVAAGNLSSYRFPAADEPVLRALGLASHYAITTAAANDASFLRGVSRILDQGVRLVQFRDPSLTRGDFIRRASLARELCRPRGAQLLINADPEGVFQSGADGVHLNAQRLHALHSRPLDTRFWVGASCHNAHDVRHARKIGCDFIVLSPVKSTASHPGAVPLGWRSFAELALNAGLPVYALGGVGPLDMETARAHGAIGVAGIRAWWPGDA